MIFWYVAQLGLLGINPSLQVAVSGHTAGE